MLTVRFPSGVSIRYNDANYTTRGDNFFQLYTKDPNQGGKWVATVSTQGGCVIEAIPACKVENPVNNLTGEAALKHVVNNIRDFDGYSNGRMLQQLKAELVNFNAQMRQWKD